MKARLARWASWMAWVLGAFLTGPAEVRAVELVEGPKVQVDADRATIRWRTDVAAGGRVQWGTSPDKLVRRDQGPVGTEHAVTLGGLKPGTRYHFTVGTARFPLATNTFVAGGTAVTPTAPTAAPDAVPGNAGATTSGAGGSTSSPVAQPQAPPTSATWGSMPTLRDHFDRHGGDFGARNPDDYARQAWLFLQRAKKEGLPAKRDAQGVLRVYDPATRAFGAYNRDGTTRTYFKPGRRDYFDDQPGRPVNLRQER